VFYDHSTQAGRDASAKALARAKMGKPLAVSVEHGGQEAYNPTTKRNEAVSLWFSGLASVERGACRVCNMPRANEAGTGDIEMNEEEFKAALAALKAEIMAEVKALIEGIDTSTDDSGDGDGEMEKKMSAVLEGTVKELESMKKMNEELERRIKALESAPNIQTRAYDRDLEDLVVPEGYTMRRS
jgi:DNA repair exonuclease SbcCD ATPase subunit